MSTYYYYPEAFYQHMIEVICQEQELEHDNQHDDKITFPQFTYYPQNALATFFSIEMSSSLSFREKQDLINILTPLLPISFSDS